MQTEIKKSCNLAIKNFCNIPNLVGEKCKYSTFHRCISDMHSDIHKHSNESKVAFVAHENRLRELQWEVNGF